MLRSILLALDDSASSRAAEGFAVSVAGQCGAEISASVILDEAWLRGPGDTYRDAATRQRRNDAWNNVHHIGSAFQKLAQAAHITCAVSTAAEAPGPLLANKIVEHDILVVGRNADFRYYGQPDMSSATTALVREHVRPILVVPANATAEGPVVIACDGSVAAYRAAHMFALLDMFSERKVFVLAIDRVLQRAEEIAGRTAPLLERYGLNTELLPIASEAAPAALLQERAVAVGAGMLVMGAFGHRGVRELVLGSCTREILATSPTALFLYG